MSTMLEMLEAVELSHDEMVELAKDAGLTVEEFEQALERRRKKLEYRSEYNARPGRKAYRKRYNLIRKMKEDKAIEAFKSLQKK